MEINSEQLISSLVEQLAQANLNCTILQLQNAELIKERDSLALNLKNVMEDTNG